MALCYHVYTSVTPLSAEWDGERGVFVYSSRCDLCGRFSVLEQRIDAQFGAEWSSPTGEEPCVFPRPPFPTAGFRHAGPVRRNPFPKPLPVT